MNKTLYIITNNYDHLNYRALKLLNLRNHCRVILIAQKAKELIPKHPDDILIERFVNVFGIFKKIGLVSLAKRLENIFYFPSIQVLYISKVIKYLKNNISDNISNDVTLITICPPHDIGIVGFNIKTMFKNITWINDLQDLWSYDEYYFNQFDKSKQKRIRNLENIILKSADFTITTNGFAKAVLCKNYDIPEHKVLSIYHPFDRNEFSSTFINNKDTLRIDQKEVISLAFVGMLNKEPKVPGTMLVDVLNKYVEKYNCQIEFNLIGDKVSPEIKKNLNKKLLINEYIGLSHSQAFAVAGHSDYLIILLGDVPNARVIMHAKLSHYLILKKPIIAFVPEDSFVAKVIKDTGSGYVVDFHKDWCCELNNIFCGIYLLPKRNEKEIEKFSIDNFMRKVESII